jgi:uncharacterized LabA/DUF88 family protein
MQFKNKHYLIESGEALEVAEKYRKAHIEYHSAARAFLENCGATSGQTCHDGRFFSLKFEKGKVPENFKKPNKYGYVEPFKKNKEWLEKLETSPASPVVSEFIDGVIDAVLSLEYEGEHGKGGCCIGNPFNPIQICFFSKESPLLLIVPDVKHYVRLREINGYTVTSKKSHTLPEGLKEILREEWDLMVAKHKQKEGE